MALEGNEFIENLEEEDEDEFFGKELEQITQKNMSYENLITTVVSADSLESFAGDENGDGHGPDLEDDIKSERVKRAIQSDNDEAKVCSQFCFVFKK